jgi:DNA-binding transcriptional regulator YdaS (Cro superfamily)
MSDPSIARAALEAAILKAGSGAALTRLAGVHRSSISEWRRSGVPAKHVPAIADGTGIPRHKLRPDLWQAAECSVAA